MFALLSMILLEFACRVCSKDTSGRKLDSLTVAFAGIERRYFSQLPGPWGHTNEFTLPGPNPDSHLLGMIFDLVRNGKAHQYQSPVATLPDGDVDIDLTGAMPDRALEKRGRQRPAEHLCYKLSAAGDLSLYVCTDQLFLDIKQAIQESRIISPGDAITDIVRPKPAYSHRKSSPPPSTHYAFKVADLKNALNRGGHSQGNW
jgi:hypothetical protein